MLEGRWGRLQNFRTTTVYELSTSSLYGWGNFRIMCLRGGALQVRFRWVRGKAGSRVAKESMTSWIRCISFRSDHPEIGRR
jgi:hypothetical protein